VTSRVTGAPVTGLGFRYRDEYFYAVGAQYQLNDQWKFRAGAAYEISPITDETRGVRLLDNDRIWLSAGVGYKFSEKLEFDLGYTHIFLKDGKVNIGGPGSGINPAGNPAFTAFNYTGNSRGSVDIVAFSLKYRFDDPAPSAAPIVKPVVKKF
jgi:long-chain fatty acid transport protein